MAREMTTGTFRIDKETKDAAEQALQKMGMNLSAGINIFLAQVAREQALPFRPGEKTAGEALEVLRETETSNQWLHYDPYDPVVRKAVEIALKQGRFSSACIQTWLGKGHGYVSRLALWLEGIGVIEPKNGHKPRRVLIRTMEEFEEKAQQR